MLRLDGREALSLVPLYSHVELAPCELLLLSCSSRRAGARAVRNARPVVRTSCCASAYLLVAARVVRAADALLPCKAGMVVLHVPGEW